MPPAAMAGIGIGSGLLTAFGNNKANKDRNGFLRGAAAQFNPQQLQMRMQGMNPDAYSALFQGNEGQDGTYQNNLWNLANNPGQVDEKLMNMPMQTSQRGAQNDFVAASGKLGKSGGRGGLSNALALSSNAADTQRRAQIQQQYGLFSEQQRRTDMNMIQQYMSGMQGQAMQGAGGNAQYSGQQQPGMNFAQGAGNAMQSGLYAYGAAGGGQNQMQQNYNSQSAGNYSGVTPQQHQAWQGGFTGPVQSNPNPPWQQ